MCNIVIWQFYALWCSHPSNSSNYPSLCKLITTLLTVFPFTICTHHSHNYLFVYTVIFLSNSVLCICISVDYLHLQQVFKLPIKWFLRYLWTSLSSLYKTKNHFLKPTSLASCWPVLFFHSHTAWKRSFRPADSHTVICFLLEKLFPCFSWRLALWALLPPPDCSVSGFFLHFQSPTSPSNMS